MGNEAFQGSQTARVVPFPGRLSHGLGVPTVFDAVMPDSSSLAVWRLQPVLPDLQNARLGTRPLRYKKAQIGGDQMSGEGGDEAFEWMIIRSRK